MRIRIRRDPVARRLEAERPQPPDEFVSRLAKRLVAEPIQRRGLRVALAGGFTALLVLAFALTGGIGYAASAVKGGTTAVTGLVTGPPRADKANENANKSEEKSENKPGQAGNRGSGPPTSSESTDSSSQASGQGAEDKVTICHIPPGNPENAHTITVGASAVPAHLAHGDSLGPCPDDPSPPDDQYEDKVLICHIPPGNPGNAHTIRVSVNAVPAHVAHGDPVPPDLGPCA